eukprot:Skav217942  [mRNA]  locus=scaffold2100:37690:42751:- [translate_table: standard]
MHLPFPSSTTHLAAALGKPCADLASAKPNWIIECSSLISIRTRLGNGCQKQKPVASDWAQVKTVQSEHPIRRVIRLVEERELVEETTRNHDASKILELAEKSVEEGKEEQLTPGSWRATSENSDQYDKFVAWCEKSSKGLNKAIGKETEVVEKTSGKGLTKELSELEVRPASASAAADDRAEQKKQSEQSVKEHHGQRPLCGLAAGFHWLLLKNNDRPIYWSCLHDKARNTFCFPAAKICSVDELTRL